LLVLRGAPLRDRHKLRVRAAKTIPLVVRPSIGIRYVTEAIGIEQVAARLAIPGGAREGCAGLHTIL
jgi:hypothetical protein